MARKPKKSELEVTEPQTDVAVADEPVPTPEVPTEKAARAPRERTYTGSMLALADRARSGQYVKGANGQLRSTDEVALALETIPAKQMPDFLVGVLGLESNPYTHLNAGQQSMTLRNKLRGAIKAGTVTLGALQNAVEGHHAAQPA